eukprot:1358296-Amorphochlora_amoeboformis.AAC.1
MRISRDRYDSFKTGFNTGNPVIPGRMASNRTECGRYKGREANHRQVSSQDGVQVWDRLRWIHFSTCESDYVRGAAGKS